jgi:hypothetical protein
MRSAKRKISTRLCCEERSSHVRLDASWKRVMQRWLPNSLAAAGRLARSSSCWFSNRACRTPIAATGACRLAIVNDDVRSAPCFFGGSRSAQNHCDGCCLQHRHPKRYSSCCGRSHARQIRRRRRRASPCDSQREESRQRSSKEKVPFPMPRSSYQSNLRLF